MGAPHISKEESQAETQEVDFLKRNQHKYKASICLVLITSLLVMALGIGQQFREYTMELSTSQEPHDLSM